MADKKEPATKEPSIKAGLARLREPFDESTISKKPMPTKNQTESLRADSKLGINCQVCGGWHHKHVVHLDYVGHAAVTDRLLECDLAWNWVPLAFNEDMTPKMDSAGGMWIYLTVCGVTRLGYGDAGGKHGGNAIKEVIGDAIRNSAMRFGAALDLWHKGDLHAIEAAKEQEPEAPKKITGDQFIKLRDLAETAGVDTSKVADAFNVGSLEELHAADFAKVVKKLGANIAEKAMKNTKSQSDTNDQPPPETNGQSYGGGYDGNGYDNNQYAGA